MAGWGRVPFEAIGSGWLTVYVLAPVLGGVLGGGLYEYFFRRAYSADTGTKKPEEAEATLLAEPCTKR
jgi:hypothetical protein